MPEYVISNTGGNFTDTAAWVGGVVPPSATSSDIIGASTSGPLYFNNLGSRNIGSLYLIDYNNTIGYTGSSTTLNVYGPTFGLGPSVSWVGNVGSGTLASQNLYFRGYGPATNLTQSVITNGVPVKKVNVYFYNTTTNQGTIALHDKLYLHENARLFWHADSTPTNTNFLVGSLTQSERAIIEIDPLNIGTAVVNGSVYWQTPRLSANNKGYNCEIILKGTGTGRLAYAEENYPGSGDNVIPYESIFTIESGEFNIETVLTLTRGNTIKYIGGTISTTRSGTNTRPKSIIIRPYTNTNTPDYPQRRSSTKFDTPGVVWDLVNPQYNLETVTDFEIGFLNKYDGLNMVIEPLMTTQNLNTQKVRLVGTNSQVNLGNVMIVGPNMVKGGAFSNGWWYVSNNLEFQGGYTYSMKSFNATSAYLDGRNFWGTQQNQFRNIYGTAGTANLEFSTNSNMTRWFSYQNINVSGTNKLYELGGGTISSSTGVESALPTGGTPSGGGEVSYVYLS